MSTGQQIKEIFDQCLVLFEDRNGKGYHDSWRGRTGIKGVFAQIESKTDRLFEQVWNRNDTPPDLRAAIDSARDNIVYNAFMIILLKELLEKNDAKDTYQC